MGRHKNRVRQLCQWKQKSCNQTSKPISGSSLFVRRTYKQSEVYAKVVGLILSETILTIGSII